MRNIAGPITIPTILRNYFEIQLHAMHLLGQMVTEIKLHMQGGQGLWVFKNSKGKNPSFPYVLHYSSTNIFWDISESKWTVHGKQWNRSLNHNPSYKIRPLLSPAGRTWVSYLSTLHFKFLFSKIKIIIVPTPSDHIENYIVYNPGHVLRKRLKTYTVIINIISIGFFRKLEVCQRF